ncbi:MAG: hypothetical protein ACYDCI_02475 [Candidatus Limnocylindrales bacterium]
MKPSILVHRASLAGVVAILASLLFVAPTQAHVLKDFGSYSVALGWAVEPTYLGEVNAVQVVVKDQAGKAITDLADGAMQVVVSAAGQQSDALQLLNRFDPDTGLGVPGDYEASIIPTVPGDYTFHLTGSIHGTPVDETATSSDSTFDSVVGSTDIEFPAKLPALSDVSTRLDRLDGRISALSDGTSGSTALAVGAGLGGLGLVVGLVALAVALRGRRKSAG